MNERQKHRDNKKKGLRKNKKSGIRKKIIKGTKNYHSELMKVFKKNYQRNYLYKITAN